jgi:hypothetical protein
VNQSEIYQIVNFDYEIDGFTGLSGGKHGNFGYICDDLATEMSGFGPEKLRRPPTEANERRKYCQTGAFNPVRRRAIRPA